MNARSILRPALAVAYLLLWVGGVGSYIAFRAPPEDAAWTAPVFLLLATGIVVLSTPRAELRDLGTIALVGFASEYLGVTTGLIFGRYEYTGALGPTLLGVPLVMTCAWTLLVVYVRQIVRLTPFSHAVAALVGALWMTAIDLVIDPLAAGRLAYWRWSEPGAYYGIPVHNFVGWLTVSALILMLLPRRAGASGATIATGWSIVLFFTVIALATGLVVPGAIGLALCIAHPALALAHRRAPVTTGAPITSDSLALEDT